MEHLRILDPTARAEGVDVPAPTGEGFHQQRVALLTNKWPSWDAITDLFASDLKERFEAEAATRWEVPIASGAPDEVLDEVAAGSDLALVGLAN